MKFLALEVTVTPDAVAFPEAIGQLGGADLQADDLAFLQKTPTGQSHYGIGR